MMPMGAVISSVTLLYSMLIPKGHADTCSLTMALPCYGVCVGGGGVEPETLYLVAMYLLDVKLGGCLK